MKHYVITLTRQFASNGRPIAQAMSRELGIEFYDRDIVEATAARLGLSVREISDSEDTHSTSFFRSLYPLGTGALSVQDELFQTQSNIIRDLADKESCIIVGRCADYILDTANIPALNVFIHANMEYRKAHVLERYGKTNVPIEKRLRKKDKGRKTYYRYYTDREWGQSNYYHISLDASYLGELTCVDIITSAARRKNENK